MADLAEHTHTHTCSLSHTHTKRMELILKAVEDRLACLGFVSKFRPRPRMGYLPSCCSQAEASIRLNYDQPGFLGTQDQREAAENTHRKKENTKKFARTPFFCSSSSSGLVHPRPRRQCHAASNGEGSALWPLVSFCENPIKPTQSHCCCHEIETLCRLSVSLAIDLIDSMVACFES